MAKTKPVKTVKILSIDGGGIRGIIPALLLQEIERKTKKPISSLFHLIAGTSTGGLISLALTKPEKKNKPAYTAEQVVQLYENEGKNIFHRSLFHTINSIGNILDTKYEHHGIEDVLDRYFGNSRLKDSLTNVLITSYDIEKRHSLFFKSSKAKDPNEQDRDFFMKDIARATSAAPTYFAPHKLSYGNATDYYALIDGGIFANNPTMCAYVEAKKLYPHATDFLIVSLGTGEMSTPLPYYKAEHWGLLSWAKPMLDVVFDGISDTVDYQIKKLVPNKRSKKRYYRFQTKIDRSCDVMDKTNSYNMKRLKDIAENLISYNKNDIEMVCKELRKL